MNFKKSITVVICIMTLFTFVIASVSAVDQSGTFSGGLTEGDNYIDIYTTEEYIGEYTDYRIYWADLEENQKIEVTLEVPGGADFDLFLYTEDESRDWSSTSDLLGEDEKLTITIPETGEYKFVVASWIGDGDFTLHWETPGAVSSILLYVLIAIIIVVILIIVIIFLRRRKKTTHIPPPPGYGMQSTIPPVVSMKPQQQCPHCGGPLNWIEQYNRWYCYKCSKYV